MAKINYHVEKHVTTEYLVMATKEGEALKTPAARCYSEGAALTIKGLYEKAEEEGLNPKIE